MKQNKLMMIAAAFAAAFSFTGCVTAHVEYSLSDVKPVRGSVFAGQSLFVEKFQDTRHKDKNSVSTYVFKNGMYGAHSGRAVGSGDPDRYKVGLRPNPQMSDYREIFKGVAYSPDTSYYCAPDRLYWDPSGPLKETREMLAKHIAATRMFRTVTATDGAQCDFSLKLNVRRFLSLKERRPVVDVVDIFWTGYLFSSDEVISSVVDWSLVRNRDGKVVASGTANYASVENHHVYGAQNKPFKMNSKAAKKVAEQIVDGIKAVR